MEVNPFTRRAAPAVILLLVFANLVMATPAAASPNGVEVSPDGSNFSATYSGSLFTSISHLVPGDSEQVSFYLRNSANEPGFLRITLRDVVASDADFAQALSVSARTVHQAGAPATFLEANPCWVLLEGQRVAPGEIVRVTTSLALGDLRGQAGQGATTTAGLRVALSGTAAQLPPTDCGGSGTTLPVVPRPGASQTNSHPPSSVIRATNGEDVVVAQRPDTELPVLSLPGLFGIDPNTWHLFEEYLILIPIGSSFAGGVAFGIVAWRRRKRAEELEAEA